MGRGLVAGLSSHSAQAEEALGIRHNEWSCAWADVFSWGHKGPLPSQGWAETCQTCSGHCLECAFHWLLWENKFPPSLLGNSSSLSSWQRKEFISIVSNILKDSGCHVDFSGTVSVIKQCTSWKEKAHHLIWIFPPSSLIYKAQQFRSETPLSAEHFWVTKVNTETGVGMGLETLWNLFL